MMCQDGGVPKSNGGSPRLGLGERTRIARGGDWGFKLSGESFTRDYWGGL